MNGAAQFPAGAPQFRVGVRKTHRYALGYEVKSTGDPPSQPGSHEPPQKWAPFISKAEDSFTDLQRGLREDTHGSEYVAACNQRMERISEQISSPRTSPVLGVGFTPFSGFTGTAVKRPYQTPLPTSSTARPLPTETLYLSVLCIFYGVDSPASLLVVNHRQ